MTGARTTGIRGGAVKIALAGLALWAAQASAALCPSQGRFLQRDPARDATDGVNLYQYVGANPTGYSDPQGLWKGEEHKTLTSESYNDAFPDKVEGKKAQCKDWLVKTLTDANLSQDGGAAFNDLKRHYNHKPKTAKATSDKDYTDYLASEVKTFDDQVKAAGEAAENAAKKQSCLEAAQALGRLTHTWQDYFAHAVLLSGKAGPAWAATPAITGTPDAMNANLRASSWGGWNVVGEHGTDEPASRDKPGGEKKRYDDAKTFVSGKLKTMVAQWMTNCESCCPPEEEKKGKK